MKTECVYWEGAANSARIAAALYRYGASSVGPWSCTVLGCLLLLSVTAGEELPRRMRWRQLPEFRTFFERKEKREAWGKSESETKIIL